MGASVDGKLYVFGGLGPGWIPQGLVYEYDPANDSWKTLAAMPTKRGSAVAAMVNGKIYVIGGAALHPGSSEPAMYPARPHRSMNSVEEYDPKTNSWSELPMMPIPRHGLAGAVVGNR
ncbi:MAG: kelch repeat-containing protein [Nitrospiraceae bacterium]